MVAPALNAAKKFDLPCMSIPRIKPFAKDIDRLTEGFGMLIILEEHSRYGGLASALMDSYSENSKRLPDVRVLSLEDKFSDRCGDYQYALSEHGLADTQILARVGALVSGKSLINVARNTFAK
jgi:transketolase